MTTEELAGLDVVDAVRESLAGRSHGALAEIARRCGVGVSSLYQWGERKPDGRPRMKIPAESVGDFCAATKTDLLLRVIQRDVLESMRPCGDCAQTFTDNQIFKECSDIASCLGRSLEDGKFTEAERTELLREVREFVVAIEHRGKGHVCGDNVEPFRRASTMAEAERMGR